MRRGEDLLNHGGLGRTRPGCHAFLRRDLFRPAEIHGAQEERGVANLVEVLRRIGEKAQASNIKVGVEVVNRYETNIVNTADEVVALLDRIGQPNLYAHLDTYHMNIEDGFVGEAIERCGDRIGYFHVGESHRGYLGTGTVDFTAVFLGSLARIGYDGPIAFEFFSSAVVDPVLSNMLGVWRNLWSDGYDLARHAKAFMEAQQLAAAHAVKTGRAAGGPPRPSP